MAVCETRSFTEAANRCHVTQPAITKSIKKLEAEIGVTLLQRSSRGLALTHFGELLRHHVACMQGQTRYFQADLAALIEGRRGRLRLGVGYAVASTMLPHLVAALQERFPGIDVEFETAVSDELYPRLLDGAIDIMIASIMGLSPTREVTIEELFPVDMAVFAREGHPLLQTPFRPADLQRYRWYLFTHDIEGRRALDRYFDANGVACPTVAFRSSALAMLLELTRLTDGLAYLASTLASEAELRGLCRIDMPQPIWSFRIGMAVRTEAASVAPLRFLADQCRAYTP